MRLKNYKLVFKKNLPKENFRKKPGTPSYSLNLAYYRFVLARDKTRIKGNKSGVYFLISSIDPVHSVSFNNPELYFKNEIFYQYDFLTEGMYLQDYLNNPVTAESRYAILNYDELKRKGFTIIKKHVDSIRVYKSQKVAYFLYHNSKKFPSGWMVENNKPSDVIIRLDSQENQVRIEGPNCISIWNSFNL